MRSTGSSAVCAWSSTFNIAVDLRSSSTIGAITFLAGFSKRSRGATSRGKVFRKGGVMKRLLAIVVVFAVSSVIGLAQGGRAGEHWVGAWSTAVVVATPVAKPAAGRGAPATNLGPPGLPPPGQPAARAVAQPPAPSAAQPTAGQGGPPIAPPG